MKLMKTYHNWCFLYSYVLKCPLARFSTQKNIFETIFGYLKFTPQCPKKLTTILNRVIVSEIGKIWCFLFFSKISKMVLFGQNWPKFDLNVAIYGYNIRPEALVVFFEKLKENFFKSKKDYFWRQKSTFCPYKHHYDFLLPTLYEILKFLKWRFFAFCFKENKINK